MTQSKRIQRLRKGGAWRLSKLHKNVKTNVKVFVCKVLVHPSPCQLNGPSFLTLTKRDLVLCTYCGRTFGHFHNEGCSRWCFFVFSGIFYHVYFFIMVKSMHGMAVVDLIKNVDVCCDPSIYDSSPFVIGLCMWRSNLFCWCTRGK